MLITCAGPASPPAAATNDDWTRVDVTDGDWTLVQPTADYLTSISNTGGINSCTVDTGHYGDFVTGGLWYKELTTGDGSSVDFADRCCTLRCYIHLPSIGWADSGTGSGGDNKPATASKTFVVMGVFTDPENLPLPRDVFGCGIASETSTNRLKRVYVKNGSQTAPSGVLGTNSANLDAISTADSAAGHKSTNRMLWEVFIQPDKTLTAAGINIDNPPIINRLHWTPVYDNGDHYSISGSPDYPRADDIDQRFGRTRTDKLYIWIAAGRGLSGAGSTQIVDFDCYYDFRILDGGVNPSGTTGLT